MDRTQIILDRITRRNRARYYADQKLMEIYHIKEDLTRECTDEIEKALWEIKDSMDLPTEEIELAIESRRKVK